ncbi:uncharacterized protein [Tiliqua scincoides]|uniref:uncharacterized protein n=1 Tax=Tiliqua scincoides TaxID=71010 RepID=UPI0034635F0B
MMAWREAWRQAGQGRSRSYISAARFPTAPESRDSQEAADRRLGAMEVATEVEESFMRLLKTFSALTAYCKSEIEREDQRMRAALTLGVYDLDDITAGLRDLQADDFGKERLGRAGESGRPQGGPVQPEVLRSQDRFPGLLLPDRDRWIPFALEGAAWKMALWGEGGWNGGPSSSQDPSGVGATMSARGAVMSGIYEGISLEKHPIPETPPNFMERK